MSFTVSQSLLFSYSVSFYQFSLHLILYRFQKGSYRVEILVSTEEGKKEMLKGLESKHIEAFGDTSWEKVRVRVEVVVVSSSTCEFFYTSLLDLALSSLTFSSLLASSEHASRAHPFPPTSPLLPPLQTSTLVSSTSTSSLSFTLERWIPNFCPSSPFVGVHVASGSRREFDVDFRLHTSLCFLDADLDLLYLACRFRTV